MKRWMDGLSLVSVESVVVTKECGVGSSREAVDAEAGRMVEVRRERGVDGGSCEREDGGAEAGQGGRQPGAGMNANGRARLAATKKGRLQSLSRDKRGGEQVRAGGEDHAELHCIPDRPSALRVGRLALFARHLLSADASRARAEQRNATRAARGMPAAPAPRRPPSPVSVRKSSCVGFGWQLTAGDFARLAVPVPSCPHLFANASDASARRCALAVFEAGQPDSELEPSRGSQKKPSLVLRPLGPFVVALSAVRDKDSADPPFAFGHRAAHGCRSGWWAMRRVIFGIDTQPLSGNQPFILRRMLPVASHLDLHTNAARLGPRPHFIPTRAPLRHDPNRPTMDARWACRCLCLRRICVVASTSSRAVVAVSPSDALNHASISHDPHRPREQIVRL
ncbi:hypothetical protein L1887_59550 [Cichorium endivia]|nr:hypothetical protein L1887_59550 [Cichorium endivia]